VTRENDVNNHNFKAYGFTQFAQNSRLGTVRDGMPCPYRALGSRPFEYTADGLLNIDFEVPNNKNWVMPSYTAPEQAEGKKEVGPWADIAALGAIRTSRRAGAPPPDRLNLRARSGR